MPFTTSIERADQTFLPISRRNFSGTFLQWKPNWVTKAISGERNLPYRATVIHRWGLHVDQAPEHDASSNGSGHNDPPLMQERIRRSMSTEPSSSHSSELPPCATRMPGSSAAKRELTNAFVPDVFAKKAKIAMETAQGKPVDLVTPPSTPHRNIKKEPATTFVQALFRPPMPQSILGPHPPPRHLRSAWKSSWPTSRIETITVKVMFLFSHNIVVERISFRFFVSDRKTSRSTARRKRSRSTKTTSTMRGQRRASRIQAQRVIKVVFVSSNHSYTLNDSLSLLLIAGEREWGERG